MACTCEHPKSQFEAIHWQPCEECGSEDLVFGQVATCQSCTFDPADCYAVSTYGGGVKCEHWRPQISAVR